MSERNSDRNIPRPMMGIALAGMLSMLVAVAWGITNGRLGMEFSAMTNMAWGLVTIIDLYVGLALIATWIWWREANPMIALGWTVALATCGNIATCLYIVLAIRASRGNVHQFWSGHRDVAKEQAAPGLAAARNTNT
jgi:hypothetical protein